jgi:putative tryptophan/tyrosine transport system substrate-binding protein
MRRREFITCIGAAAAAWPLPAFAQQSSKFSTIGFLVAASPAVSSFWVAAFVERLHELGWVEGRTVAIEYRWAEGQPDRFSKLAMELVQLKVDVIVTHGTPAAIATKNVTSVIPIIAALLGDPIAAGLVTSYSHPGGNVTGLSTESTELVGKRIEILRDIVPGLRRLAIMADAGSPEAVLNMREAKAAAQKFGVEVTTAEIHQAEEFGPAFERLRGSVDALYVVPDALTVTNRVRISTLSLGLRLPTMYGAREYVETGGLISYGANMQALFRRAADYVDKILHGAKPGDIPVEQPTKFDLVINVTTAKVLGLTIPGTILARADEVIE